MMNDYEKSEQANYARLPRCRHCGEAFVSLLGAGSDAGRFCNACAQYEGFPDANEPQGESVRLFEPAPTQMPGQTAMRCYCDTAGWCAVCDEATF